MGGFIRQARFEICTNVTSIQFGTFYKFNYFSIAPTSSPSAILMSRSSKLSISKIGYLVQSFRIYDQSIGPIYIFRRFICLFSLFIDYIKYFFFPDVGLMGILHSHFTSFSSMRIIVTLSPFSCLFCPY